MSLGEEFRSEAEAPPSGRAILKWDGVFAPVNEEARDWMVRVAGLYKLDMRLPRANLEAMFLGETCENRCGWIIFWICHSPLTLPPLPSPNSFPYDTYPVAFTAPAEEKSSRKKCFVLHKPRV